MKEVKLVLPSAEYKESFLEALQEFHIEGRNLDLDALDLEHDFDSFVRRKAGEPEGKFLPEGFVPQTDYWLVHGDEYLGHIAIRHLLNDTLMQRGGNIGYAIRPSKRRQGYGTIILKLGLEKAKMLGISRALVTCDKDNIASRQIIEKNGGILENESVGDKGETVLRFWVPTA